jgi:hypothetical protein
MEVIMDNECKYLKIEDVTLWHGDVFDHPSYEYYCTKKNKDLPFGIFQCHKCTKYDRREDN